MPVLEPTSPWEYQPASPLRAWWRLRWRIMDLQLSILKTILRTMWNYATVPEIIYLKWRTRSQASSIENAPTPQIWSRVCTIRPVRFFLPARLHINHPLMSSGCKAIVGGGIFHSGSNMARYPATVKITFPLIKTIGKESFVQLFVQAWQRSSIINASRESNLLVKEAKSNRLNS